MLRCFRKVLGTLCLAVGGCGGTEPEPPVPTTLAVTPSEVSFPAVAEAQQLTASVLDQDGLPISDASVTWATSAPSVASISASGLATAVGDGVATATATSGSAAGTAQISVTQVAASMTVSVTELLLAGPGATANVTATLADRGGSPILGAVLVWSSDDESVATVDAGGLVTAVAEGTATLTVQASSGGQTLSQQVALTVNEDLHVATAELANGVEGVAYGPEALAATGGDPTSYEWALATGSGPLPTGLDLASSGDITGTPSSPGPSSFIIEVTSGDGQAAQRELSITVHSLLEVTTSSLPNAVEGLSYGPAAMTAAGGDGEYSWTLSSGTLPLGLTLEATGELTGTPTTAGAWLFDIEVSSGDDQVATQQFTVTVNSALAPPYRFSSDLLITMPSQPAQILILDSNDAVVPPPMVTYDVDHYGRCCSWGFGAEILDIDGDGVARPVGDFAEDPFDLRVRASVAGTAVEGLTLAVVHAVDRVVSVFRTDEWLLVIPPGWMDEITAVVPDFALALDLGLAAQRELMGKTAEEAHNDNSPADPVLPISAAVEAARGSMFDTCARALWPIRYTRNCFIYAGSDLPSGTPQWYVIFHELGHMSTFEHEDLLFRLFSQHAYLEGEANVQWLWSAHRMAQSGQLAAGTRASIQTLLDRSLDGYRNALASWEASSAPYEDSFGGAFTLAAWSGIHATLIEESGWDYLLRYARGWRDDAYVLSRIPTPISMASRATFAAAAVSAALQVDMRDRFVDDWRFPLDDELFDDLYAHLLTEMSAPW